MSVTVVVYIVAVDDDVVEQLLQLTADDASTSDDARTEFSLKSVAGLLYRQPQHTDTGDNDAVDSCDIPDDPDELDLPQVMPAAVESQMSVSNLSSGVTSDSATAVDVSHTLVDCMTRGMDSGVKKPSPVVECLPNISATPPYFCIPTVPVLSPCALSMQRGRGGRHEHVCNTRALHVHCDVSEQRTKLDESPSVSLAHAQNTLGVSSNNTWNSFTSSQTSLSNVPACSYLSSSRPVLSSDCRQTLQQTMFYSQYSNKTLTSTSEAASRVRELLTVQCKVLVLMRGCPGSGKTTMAKYVPFVSTH